MSSTTVTKMIRNLLEKYPDNQCNAREIYDWLRAERKLPGSVTINSIGSLLNQMEHAGYIARIARGQYAAASNRMDKHPDYTNYGDCRDCGVTIHN